MELLLDVADGDKLVRHVSPRLRGCSVTRSLGYAVARHEEHRATAQRRNYFLIFTRSPSFRSLGPSMITLSPSDTPDARRALSPSAVSTRTARRSALSSFTTNTMSWSPSRRTPDFGISICCDAAAAGSLVMNDFVTPMSGRMRASF